MRFLWLFLIALWSQNLLAGGLELYSERPAILELSPERIKTAPDEWGRLKDAHLHGLAALVELYPTEHIYFLARDAEYLYDLLRVLGQEDKALNTRIHLLNISRKNQNDPNVKKYLAQEGLSEAALSKGGRAVLIDTGFRGSIIKTVQNLFPTYAEQIHGHLIISDSQQFPSLRAFLAQLNPESVRKGPGSLSGTLLGYEYMPRFAYRSEGFKKVGDEWVAFSQNNESDGKVSRSKALTYMRDIREYGSRSENKQRFAVLRDQWRRIQKFAGANDSLSLNYELRRLIGTQGQIGEAVARDFLDFQSTNGRTPIAGVTAQSLNLTESKILIPTKARWTCRPNFQNTKPTA